MEFLQSAILGTIEGVTEYLPVSSSFHIIQAARFLGIAATDYQKAYEVIIQAGAILAVVVLYWRTFLSDRDVVKKIIVAFVPTAVIGLVLYKIIKGFFFENILLQLAVFIGVGILFIVFEKYRQGITPSKTVGTLTLTDCVLIGLVQATAVIPGVSRSGAVILIMMYLGVKRDQAAKFSFLLAVPTLLAASGFDLLKYYPIILASPNKLVYLFVGFIFSFLSALLVIRWFIQFLQKHDLIVFGWYRIALGLILLLGFVVFK